jgi:hypothetical protein
MFQAGLIIGIVQVCLMWYTFRVAAPKTLTPCLSLGFCLAKDGLPD